MSKDELDKLNPKEKKVVAKALMEQGYSSRRLEELLGMDNVSVWRASQEVTPEDLQQFETDFKTAINEMKRQGISLVQKRLLELIPKERRIDMVVKAGEYLEGKNTGNNILVKNDGNMTVEFE